MREGSVKWSEGTARLLVQITTTQVTHMARQLALGRVTAREAETLLHRADLLVTSAPGNPEQRALTQALGKLHRRLARFGHRAGFGSRRDRTSRAIS